MIATIASIDMSIARNRVVNVDNAKVRSRSANFVVQTKYKGRLGRSAGPYRRRDIHMCKRKCLGREDQWIDPVNMSLVHGFEAPRGV